MIVLLAYWRWIAGAAAALVVTFAVLHYGETRFRAGVASVRAQDQAAVAHALTQDEITAHNDALAISREAQTYAHAVATAVSGAPIISVCVPEPRYPLPPAARPTARLRAAQGADLRAATAPVPAQSLPWDTATVLQIAHDADAQIAGLEDYIARVCPSL